MFTVELTSTLGITPAITILGAHTVATITYYIGQSVTVQHVYNDRLRLNGTLTVRSSMIQTTTITYTITIPVTQTIPCHQCVPEQVIEHVSILQLLFGY